MRAIRASLATRLGAAAVVAVLATGGAIAAATAAGAARSHQKPQETALSIKHKAIRAPHASCGRHDGLASQENRDEAKMGCGRDRANGLVTLTDVTTAKTLLKLAVGGVPPPIVSTACQ